MKKDITSFSFLFRYSSWLGVCAVGVAILGTTSNMAAQSFLYHQVRRASQSATSHFSPQGGGKKGFLFALFLSDYSLFTLERTKYSGSKFRFLVIHQDPIRRIPYSIPSAGQSLPFRWLNNITSEEKKEKNPLKNWREKVVLQMVQDIKRVTPFLIRVGRFHKVKSEKNVDGWKEEEIDPHYRMNRYSLLLRVGWLVS